MTNAYRREIRRLSKAFCNGSLTPVGKRILYECMHTAQQKILDSLRRESSGVPIYVQLRDQLLRAVTTGALMPGEQMPTMRQVAVAVRVDLNTVRHAYDELERMGVIVLVRGRGSFVADAIQKVGAPQPADPAAAADALARQAMHLAGTAGVDPRHLVERILHLLHNRDN